jgi:non-specific serine/threonine protein kinase
VLGGKAERAARLFGATDAWRQARGVPLEPADRAAYTRDLTATREALEATAFQSAWAEGRSLSLDQAIGVALATEETTTSAGLASGAAVPAHDPLTRREREVAMLIAQGLTNRQIAEQPVISDRTVDNHVANILGKLAFSTRSQVAVWSVEHRLSADTSMATST